MIADEAPASTTNLWLPLLPDPRRFVALPSTRQPVVVAEKDPGVMAYVAHALLAAPPGSRTARVPAWVQAATRHALRAPVTWGVLPAVDGVVQPDATAGPDGLADWIADSGHRMLILDHSHDGDGRVVVLLFTAGQRQPSIALKVATGAGGARLREEDARLRSLRTLRMGPLRSTVPHLLPPPADPHLTVLATSAQPGVPMLVSYHRPGHVRSPARVRADFRAAGTWLAQLQSERVGGSAPLDLRPGCVEAAARVLGDRPAEQDRVLELLSSLRSRLRRYSVARTVVHGDYWPGNLLVREGRVSGVVDWERAEPRGNPVGDLVRFAVAYAHYLDRHTRPGRPVRGHPGLIAGPPGAGVLHATDGSGWFPSLVRAYLQEGLTRLDLPPSLGRDAVLADVAATAAEAARPGFARDQWSLFLALGAVES
ncbi:phosphotransferase [Oryzihumus leptocrescens]|uniref:Phosphotransferase family enzyme n=1 Tax=Oryzihumus leptocrescens TaxID=297536 RepID=A0A542Z990_9MICO|nr:phosphotransferase [Oryzihumus leptocrescens]TQL56918.1 phosphotransferase family enzyme [Oryzihumus leptocrescens]